MGTTFAPTNATTASAGDRSEYTTLAPTMTVIGAEPKAPMGDAESAASSVVTRMRPSLENVDAFISGTLESRGEWLIVYCKQ